MLGQAAQATISCLKLPQGNSCFPDASEGVAGSGLCRLSPCGPVGPNNNTHRLGRIIHHSFQIVHEWHVVFVETKKNDVN